jgi:hypothetical protein
MLLLEELVERFASRAQGLEFRNNIRTQRQERKGVASHLGSRASKYLTKFSARRYNACNDLSYRRPAVSCLCYQHQSPLMSRLASLGGSSNEAA